jgi:hypothetical protein
MQRDLSAKLEERLGRVHARQRLGIALFLPQPPKDKLGSNPHYRDRFSLSGGVRIDEGEFFTMT